MYNKVLWEYEFGGLERWNGTVEWTTGVKYWTGLLECHAPNIGEIVPGCIDHSMPNMESKSAPELAQG